MKAALIAYLKAALRTHLLLNRLLSNGEKKLTGCDKNTYVLVNQLIIIE